MGGWGSGVGRGGELGKSLRSCSGRAAPPSSPRSRACAAGRGREAAAPGGREAGSLVAGAMDRTAAAGVGVSSAGIGKKGAHVLATADATDVAAEDVSKVTVKGKEAGERKLMIGALCAFGLGLAGLAGLYAHLLPRMRAFGGEARLPHSMEDIKALLVVLERWFEVAPGEVLSLFCSTYIFMMTFAIPGSIALSVLAGALFGFGYGMALVVFCCLVGACMCYAASMAVGRPLALWLWPVKLRLFQDEVGKRRHRLLWYMAFIRVTPAFPNVFVNVAAPIVGIPFNIFLATTLLGLCVTQSVPVKGGLEISKLNSLSEIYTRSLPMMCMLSMILLAPLLLPLLLRKKGKGRRRADDKLPPV